MAANATGMNKRFTAMCVPGRLQIVPPRESVHCAVLISPISSSCPLWTRRPRHRYARRQHRPQRQNGLRPISEIHKRSKLDESPCAHDVCISSLCCTSTPGLQRCDREATKLIPGLPDSLRGLAEQRLEQLLSKPRRRLIRHHQCICQPTLVDLEARACAPRWFPPRPTSRSSQVPSERCGELNHSLALALPGATKIEI